MLKKVLITAFVAAFLLILVATPSEAVTFGQPDNGEHPYVGTLLFVQNGVGYYSCTGTLISPTVMLTAGHCTEEAGNANDVTYVRFDEDAMAGRGDYASLQDWLDNEWISGTAIAHPQYDDYSQFPYTYDIGVVILNTPVTNLGYGTIAPLGYLEDYTSGKGHNAAFTAVGYGLQGYIQPFYARVYARYKGSVSLIELNSTFNGGMSAKFSNSPGGGNGSGGSCYGDSGGPIFAGNTNMIVAVTSFGYTPCIGVDYQFRTDTSIAQDFIHTYAP